jgi:hypothetical protein
MVILVIDVSGGNLGYPSEFLVSEDRHVRLATSSQGFFLGMGRRDRASEGESGGAITMTKDPGATMSRPTPATIFRPRGHFFRRQCEQRLSRRNATEAAPSVRR